MLVLVINQLIFKKIEAFPFSLARHWLSEL